MKQTLRIPLLLVGAILLSGCSTPEVRQEKAVMDNLNFSELEKAKPVAETPPAKGEKKPESQPVTKKTMYSYPPVMSIDAKKEYSATLVTSKGDIVIALNAKETPATVNNFVFLAREKFYDGTIFHRTIPGFMIQGGDPEGTGMGGPGYKFPDEEFAGEYKRGTVAMANAGPDTNGSQFFIMHKDAPLPPNYVIFGQVVSGLEAVDAIATAPTKPGGEGSSPVTPVVVESVTISLK